MYLYTYIELDLIAATNIEWNTMEKLKSDKLANMIKAREEYDEECEQLLLQQEMAKQDDNPSSNKKGEKPKKGIKKAKKAKTKKVIEPPPIVDENTIVEVSNEYEQQEMKMVNQFYNSLNPSTFLLEPGEVYIEMYLLPSFYLLSKLIGCHHIYLRSI